MIRESVEEVGIVVAEADLELVHVMHRRDQNPYLDLYFRCSRWSGEPALAEPEKATDLRGVCVDELPPDIVETVRTTILAILDGRSYSDDGWDSSSSVP